MISLSPLPTTDRLPCPTALQPSDASRFHNQDAKLPPNQTEADNMTTTKQQFKEDGHYTAPKPRWFRGHFISALELRDEVIE